MHLVILKAVEDGADPADTPIAAGTVLNGRLVALERNRTEDDHDATAHAEIVARRPAGRMVVDMELRGATLYSTLQPCGMCTMASIWSKVDRVVYGAGRDDVHPMYFEDRQIDTLTSSATPGGTISGSMINVCAKNAPGSTTVRTTTFPSRTKATREPMSSLRTIGNRLTEAACSGRMLGPSRSANRS
jgi:tRNA(Arg) A34 adenosine deaminase TadA